MKFDAKYPDKTNAQKLYPDKLLGPHPEIQVTLLISQSWRVYPCFVCHTLTGWRYELMTPCCSDECADQMKAADLADVPAEATAA